LYGNILGSPEPGPELDVGALKGETCPGVGCDVEEAISLELWILSVMMC